MAATLDDQGQKLLDWLVLVLHGVSPGATGTYVGYGQTLDALRLKRLVGKKDGESLQAQGLNNLADWTKETKKPAITGLIIDRKKDRPGNGYFELFGKATSDREWWHNEVGQSKNFNWLPYVSLIAAQELTHTPTPADEDEAPPDDTPKSFDTRDLSLPPRVLVEVYRTLRDTELVRRIKRIHENVCQICGQTTELFGGKLYSEGHHIKPLGLSYGGLDTEGNILCVCPTCHVQLDYGAIQIDLQEPRKDPRHEVDELMVAYHNEKLYGKK
jgi:HNH endonuclease